MDGSEKGIQTEEISDLCDGLSLLRTKDKVIQWEELDDGEQNGEMADPFYAVACRVLTKKKVSPDSMERMMGIAWRPLSGMRMSVVAENLFIFRFFDESDLKVVLDEGPWRNDNHLIALKRLDEDEVAESEVLNHVTIWVQILNLPASRLNGRSARQLGSLLGRVVEVDSGEEGLRGSTVLRARVEIDIRRPLSPGVRMEGKNGKNNWIEFKYEKLPNFCYFCGLVDHTIRDCRRARAAGAKEGDDLPLDDSLRADLGKKVPGADAAKNWLRDGKGNRRSPVEHGGERRTLKCRDPDPMDTTWGKSPQNKGEIGGEMIRNPNYGKSNGRESQRNQSPITGESQRRMGQVGRQLSRSQLGDFIENIPVIVPGMTSQHPLLMNRFSVGVQEKQLAPVNGLGNPNQMDSSPIEYNLDLTHIGERPKPSEKEQSREHDNTLALFQSYQQEAPQDSTQKQRKRVFKTKKQNAQGEDEDVYNGKRKESEKDEMERPVEGVDGKRNKNMTNPNSNLISVEPGSQARREQ